jgi:CTP synthase
VEPEAVITAVDVDTIYEVPLRFHEQGLDEQVCKKLNIWTRSPHLNNWEDLVYKLKNPANECTIAMVGKYVDLKESYKSLNEALCHGGVANNAGEHRVHRQRDRGARRG